MITVVQFNNTLFPRLPSQPLVRLTVLLFSLLDYSLRHFDARLSLQTLARQPVAQVLLQQNQHDNFATSILWEKNLPCRSSPASCQPHTDPRAKISSYQA